MFECLMKHLKQGCFEGLFEFSTSRHTVVCRAAQETKKTWACDRQVCILQE